MTGPVVPLWRQLQAAAAVLAAVRRGESATAAIAAVAGELRPGAQALVFQALRNLGRADALRIFEALAATGNRDSIRALGQIRSENRPR